MKDQHEQRTLDEGTLVWIQRSIQNGKLGKGRGKLEGKFMKCVLTSHVNWQLREPTIWHDLPANAR